MRAWWVPLLVWIGCRDPGRGAAPVVATAPAIVVGALPPTIIGAFTQPPLPTRVPMCHGVSCSGHGRCISRARYPYLSGDVSVGCACDPGFHAHGLECVACTPVGATFDIDLRLARFRGRITWNGRDLPKDLPGDVYLISEGDVGTRGDVALGRARFDVGVIAGRYDLVLRAPAPFHEESEIVIARGIAVGGDTVFDIALPLERVTTRVTYAGALPAAGPDQGRLQLVHGTERLWIDIARDPVIAYLPRGPFSISYLPPARDEPALPPIEVALRTNVTAERGELAVDVPLVTVEGTVRGLTAPFDPALTLISFAPVGEVHAGYAEPLALASPSFSAVLVPGRYDVWLTTKRRGRDLAVKIANGVEITGGRLDLAMVPPTRLHGRLLVDSAVRDAVLVAIGEGNVWGAARIPLDGDGTFSATLPRGSYTLAVELDPGDSMAGVLALDRITLANELRWELDLPMHQVSATVTIDGVPAAPPPPGMGTLRLESLTSSVAYDVWPTPGTVPPGRYIPRFGFGSPEPAGFPAVSDLPPAPIEVTGPTMLTFDLATRRLSGAFTVDGTRSASQASISIAGRSDGDHLGELSARRYATVVVPGTYEVSFFDALARSEKHTPRNWRFNLGCITVK